MFAGIVAALLLVLSSALFVRRLQPAIRRAISRPLRTTNSLSGARQTTWDQSERRWSM